MTAEHDSSWWLLEFVGGPRDGEIVNGILGAHSATSTRLAAYRAAVAVLDLPHHR